jgi:hypothetical protein
LVFLQDADKKGDFLSEIPGNNYQQ